MNTYTTKEEYKTKDLAEASVLIVKEKKILRVERQDRICWFVFEDKEECEKIVNDFWFGDCLVNARDFQRAQNILKNRIFSKEE